MNVYCWNMLYENERLDAAIEFIQGAPFDIFCLQEVPDHFLSKLEALPYHLTSAREYTYIRKDGIPRETYSIILSRHPIISSANIAVPNWFERPGLRELFATDLLRLLRVWKWTKTRGGRNQLLAEIDLPEHGATQVFSVHLTIHGSDARRQEMQAISRTIDPTTPTLLCGDLNVFDTYRISLASWFFGASFRDALMPWRERTNAEKFFQTLGLQNPFRHQVTHPGTRGQLDHILVSSPFTVRSAQVLSERYGSDHCPIYVELS